VLRPRLGNLLLTYLAVDSADEGQPVLESSCSQIDTVMASLLTW
jgi:hypothetical protein